VIQNCSVQLERDNDDLCPRQSFPRSHSCPPSRSLAEFSFEAFRSTRIAKITYALDSPSLTLSSSVPLIHYCSVHSPEHENDSLCPRRSIACSHSCPPPRHPAESGFEAFRSTRIERITYARDNATFALRSRPRVIQNPSMSVPGVDYTRKESWILPWRTLLEAESDYHSFSTRGSDKYPSASRRTIQIIRCRLRFGICNYYGA
jgi:hypothetical protein